MGKNKRAFVFIVFLFAMAQSCRSYEDDTGWVRYAGNPVLQPGRKTGGGQNDYYNASDCCVLKDGDLYKAWYTTSGMTTASPENHCNISYAESPDGIHWTKYPGNPVLDIDPNSWDAFAVETVSVIVDPDEVPPGRYKMWYAGRTSDIPGNPAYDIGYAQSPDGKSWIKAPAPVLTRGAAGEWDNAFLEGPTVLKVDGRYLMWYAGMDAVADGQATDGKVCIGLASSENGFVWEKHPANPVLVTGSRDEWDFLTAQDPHVLLHDGLFRMWYGGKTRDYLNYGQQTGYAESTDGITWVKSVRNPVFRRGRPGSWDAVTASFGSALVEGETIKLWYTGMDKDYDPGIPEFWEIGYAEKAIVDGSLGD